ncbi:tetratricopeptide repeat protein, partial [bacterium]|nr:tetratricopeptide repeat protein [bacterium]
MKLPWRRQEPEKQDFARQLRLANDALRKNDYPAAIAAYKAILDADPGNLGVLLNLGTALHLSGQHTPAIERFEQVLARDPGHVVALINLGAAHGALGHLDRGIEALVRALEVDSTRRDLHYNLAALYQRAADQGRPQLLDREGEGVHGVDRPIGDAEDLGADGG